MVLQAIRYKRGELAILDQLKLPHQEVYVDIGGPEDARNAIRSMQVRGAPAIAIVAALSLAVWGDHYKQTRRGHRTLERALGRDTFTPSWFSHNLKYLVTSRPTAVNLADAARKLEKVVWAAFEEPGATRSTVIEAYIEATEQMLVDDVQDNENIGEHGANWILKNTSAEKPVSVLTHCNTG
jgi:methylthioribose-1-phosphate isomerase